MEAVILCGIQATGKSSFCQSRLGSTHIRLNLDMLKTRHREELLLDACLRAKQSFVIDNTNPTRAERARYIVPAKAAGFRVVGYYFESKVGDALQRNSGRAPSEQISDRGIKGTAARLEIPSLAEGFDSLTYVRMIPGGFETLDWRDEV